MDSKLLSKSALYLLRTFSRKLMPKGRRMTAFFAASFVTANAAFANPVFINTFDNSWTDASLLAKAQHSITVAENTLSGLFSNNVTIRLTLTSDQSGALASTGVWQQPLPPAASGITQDTIVDEMLAHLAAHPENTALASYFNNWNYYVNCATCVKDAAGPPRMRVPILEQEALTGIDQLTAPDTVIRLNSTFNWEADAKSVGADQFDLTGTYLHEITHAMG